MMQDQFPRDDDRAAEETARDGGADPSVAAAEARVRETREELVQTVDELTSRLDVKTRSREAFRTRTARLAAAAADVRTRAAGSAVGVRRRVQTSFSGPGRPGKAPQVAAAVSGAALLLLTVVIWRSRRR